MYTAQKEELKTGESEMDVEELKKEEADEEEGTPLVWHHCVSITINLNFLFNKKETIWKFDWSF